MQPVGKLTVTTFVGASPAGSKPSPQGDVVFADTSTVGVAFGHGRVPLNEPVGAMNGSVSTVTPSKVTLIAGFSPSPGPNVELPELVGSQLVAV